MPIPRGGGAEARRRARRADPRPRRHLRDEVARRAGRSSGGVRIRATARRSPRADGDLQRDADAALRRAARRRTTDKRERASATGASEMQIHFALSEPPRWEGDERLGRTADRPPDAGARRRLPGRERGGPRAAAGRGDGRRRPAADDGPSRVPRTAQGLLWIQLQELPWRIKGDAAGELDVGDGDVDGGAPRALRRPDPGAHRAAHPEPRVVDPRARRALARRSAGREHQPPPRRPLRRLARPRPELPLAAVRARSPGHATPVQRLWHIGASTHPGPGLGGGLRDARRPAAARSRPSPSGRARPRLVRR